MTPEQQQKLADLLAEGKSQRQMAAELGVPRRTLRRYLSAATETNLVINDLHIPWHDPKAIELALRVGDKLQPDHITLNGDVMDCWEVSNFVHQPRFREHAALVKEIDEGRKFLADLRKRFPNTEIHYLFGNHEFRWDRFIAQHARQLHGLKYMSLAEQLELEEQGIELIYSGNRESSWLWGKLLIGHFDRVSKHSSYTAKLLVEDKGISLIQAHTHRGGSHFKRVYDRVFVGYENFCLCGLEPEYVDRPNWQQGFSIVHKDRASDLFHVEQYPIVRKGTRYRVVFCGEVVEV